MMQRQIRHDAGTFPNCSGCGHEPRHIQSHGSHLREAFDVRHPTGERHSLECRCGVRTAYCATLAMALNQWQVHFAAAVPTSTVRPLLRLAKDSRSKPVTAQ